MLKDKHILVGVTGGIAAYKICFLVRELVKAGAQVRVVMTEAATRFVAPLTFSVLSGYETAVSLWDERSRESGIRTQHIDLAQWADLFVIAPATANTIAKITAGISDSLLTVLALATPKPVVLAPAMDADMYLNAVTQANLAVLRQRGFVVMTPPAGELASGLTGPGRLPEVEQLFGEVARVLAGAHRDLEGKKILVTAGPTHEPIDPVRFVGNRSSGKMGFALAQAAAMRGASVTLIAGPVQLETPRHVTRVNVETAAEMYEAVTRHARGCDAVIMAAAVADFTPAAPARGKIKKTAKTDSLTLSLAATTDILASLGRGKKNTVLVGFALETDDELNNAAKKLKAKNLDMIVLNSLRDEGAGFGTDTNVVTIIDRAGKRERLPKLSKFDTGNRILDRMRALL